MTLYGLISSKSQTVFSEKKIRLESEIVMEPTEQDFMLNQTALDLISAVIPLGFRLPSTWLTLNTLL